MNILIQINGFIKSLREADSEDQITCILDEFTRWLGFRWFAMGHHVDLVRPPRHAFRASNYDASWVRQVIEQGYFRDDPIHMASARRGTGFRWDAIDFSRLPERQQIIFRHADRYGLRAGYTVPFNLPGEYAGTCSFAGPSYDRVCPLTLAMSDIIVAAAFERVRVLMERRDGRPSRVVPKLQPQELKAMILVGRGKTDAEIGEILQITERSAHSCVEKGRRHYGNLPRPSLMLNAVFDNQFSFADVFWR